MDLNFDDSGLLPSARIISCSCTAYVTAAARDPLQPLVAATFTTMLKLPILESNRYYLYTSGSNFYFGKPGSCIHGTVESSRPQFVVPQATVGPRLWKM